MTRDEPSTSDAPDLVAVLDRTTPTDLAPIDIGRLAQTARNRRHRRAAVASVAALVVLAMAGGTVTLASREDAPNVGVVPAGPNGEVLTEPAGAWHQAADPPFEPRWEAFAGTLRDGRMLVWGGHNDAGDQPPGSSGGASAGFTDGGIYDPAADTWDEIPPAPVPPPTLGGASITTVHLVDDRLAIVTGGTDGSVNAAFYDVAEASWMEAPAQDEIAQVHDGMAWDGETLVLVRTERGDEQLDEPVTLRWRAGDDQWTTGAPFPHGVRNLDGSASNGSQLALWGGTDLDFITDEDHDAYGDGAIYDVAEDTWQPIPEGPLAAGTHAEMTWWYGRLLVGGRLGEGSSNEMLGDLAAYDPTSVTWETLPPPPEGAGAAVPVGRFGWDFVEGERPLLAAVSMQGTIDQESRWFYGDAGWELAPLPGLHRIGDFVVADPEGGFGNPGSGPYELQIRVGPDEWLAAAEAPFGNRLSGAKATNGDKLLVVGGMEGTDLNLQATAWVFDLAG